MQGQTVPPSVDAVPLDLTRSVRTTLFLGLPMATAERTWSAQEFALLPEPADGSLQELVRGVVVVMPPPRGPHGQCCANLVMLLGAFAKTNRLGRVLSNDTGMLTERNPDTVRGADVAFWRFDSLPTVPVNEYIAVPPELAVEVLSPGNVEEDIREKVVEYLAFGVRMVWIADPADRTVTVYRTPEVGKILHEQAMLDGEDVLVGFSCRVSELFE